MESLGIIQMGKASNLIQLLKGNPQSQIKKALSFTQESVIKELANLYGIPYTDKATVINELSKLI